MSCAWAIPFDYCETEADSCVVVVYAGLAAYGDLLVVFRVDGRLDELVPPAPQVGGSSLGALVARSIRCPAPPPDSWHGSLRWRHAVGARSSSASTAGLDLCELHADGVTVVWPGEVHLGPDAAPSSGYTAARDSITSTLLAAALNWGDATSTKWPTRLASP